jgi:hypothetical protein
MRARARDEKKEDAEAQIKIGSLGCAPLLAQAALRGMEFGNKTKLVLLGNITAPAQENPLMGKLSAADCCRVFMAQELIYPSSE